jgi:hypothetical protein
MHGLVGGWRAFVRTRIGLGSQKMKLEIRYFEADGVDMYGTMRTIPEESVGDY